MDKEPVKVKKNAVEAKDIMTAARNKTLIFFQR